MASRRVLSLPGRIYRVRGCQANFRAALEFLIWTAPKIHLELARVPLISNRHFRPHFSKLSCLPTKLLAIP